MSPSLPKLPKLPSLHEPKPFKKRAMTIHGMMRDKLGSLAGKGKFLKTPKVKGFSNANFR